MPGDQHWAVVRKTRYSTNAFSTTNSPATTCHVVWLARGSKARLDATSARTPCKNFTTISKVVRHPADIPKLILETI
jgi:hypothetical protein